jgi:transcriptional regulator with XRE-family HTH domain
MLISFGARVRELREAAGLRGVDLAEEVGTSPADISNIERSPLWEGYKRYGRLPKVRAIASAVGVDWLSLLPNWILSRGWLRFDVSQEPRHYARPGVEGMKLFFLAYLLRNWGRLTESDLRELNQKLVDIHDKWGSH